MTRLNEMGFWTAKQLEQKPSRRGQENFKGVHGFDMTKLNPACILFVPAARLDSFFIEVPGAPINACSIMEEIAIPAVEQVQPIKIEHPPVHEPLPTDLTAQMKALAEKLRVEREGRFEIRKAERIKVVLEGWSQDDLSGQHDAGIFRLVVRLRNAGCDSSEAASISEMAIRGSRSSDRSGDIIKAKRAVRTLRLGPARWPRHAHCGSLVCAVQMMLPGAFKGAGWRLHEESQARSTKQNIVSSQWYTLSTSTEFRPCESCLIDYMGKHKKYLGDCTTKFRRDAHGRGHLIMPHPVRAAVVT